MDDDQTLASVAVDMPLSHLDRFFDYIVPQAMNDDAQVGARVRVRFAGRVCNGFIVGRPQTTEAKVKLSPLQKVVSPEPVLNDEQVRLIRAVADHFAGTFADVARLAVPPRHAATEQAARSIWPEPLTGSMPPGGLLATSVGQTWLAGVETGRPLRACWTVPPVFDNWLTGVVQAVVACLRSGKNAIVAVPDVATVDEAWQALNEVLGIGTVARLHYSMGPAQRYREYLAVARGLARVVVGTRPVVYAPMRSLGLVVMTDDGNDLYEELRAPYPNSRTAAIIRVAQAKCALLLAGAARSCETQQLIEKNWLGSIEQPLPARRSSGPVVRVVGDIPDRLPSQAAQVIRQGLAAGPVLVQVPRAGYLLALCCQTCRTPITCPTCHGPVDGQRSSDGARWLACRWCGKVITGWRCQTCGGGTVRAPVVGSGRTAEELGRAFPGYQVVDSSGDHVFERVGTNPALVVATPGAEPRPDDGYAAAALLDTDKMLMLPDLRAAEEAVRRWFAVCLLLRPGGTLCVVGDARASAIQALVRLDPGGFAARELQERREAGFPPAMTFVVATGPPDVLADLAQAVAGVAECFGPVGVPDGEQRLIWRCPPGDAPTLVAAVKAAVARRVANKAPGVFRVQVDPYQMG